MALPIWMKKSSFIKPSTAFEFLGDDIDTVEGNSVWYGILRLVLKKKNIPYFGKTL